MTLLQRFLLEGLPDLTLLGGVFLLLLLGVEPPERPDLLEPMVMFP
jgi:hypothetical protein